MARKLKSDKVLFLATLLLVCSSVVMVYSASAVLAMNRFNQPYFFLIKQAMWAALGLAAMSIAMRFDYRNYREPSFIWFVARAGRPWRWSPCCSARRSTAAAAGSASAGFGVQPSELAKLSAIFFIAAHARAQDGPHRRDSRTRSCRSASSWAGSSASFFSSRISARR